jgi:hypothetical protein
MLLLLEEQVEVRKQDGKYSIKASAGEVLPFSFVGMKENDTRWSIFNC